MISFITRYVWRYWRYYLAGFFAVLVTTVVSSLIPLKIKEAIDLMVAESSFFLIKPVLIYLIGLALILALSRTLSRLLIFFPGRFVEYDLRNDLFSHLLSLSPRYFRSQKIGDLMSRLINDMQSLRATAALGFLHSVNTVLIYVFVVYQMLQIHVSLAVWVLLPIPVMMLFIAGFVRYLYQYVRQCQMALGEFANFFVDIFSHIRIVKTAVAEPAMLSLFQARNQDYFEKNIKLAQIRSAMFPFIGIIGSFGQLILLFFGGRLIIEQQLSIGDFVAMSAYVMLLGWPTVSLAWIINIIQRGKVAWERIDGILSESSEFVGTRVLPDSGDISLLLEDLHFSYDADAVFRLSGISLSVKSGQRVGVFGPSGSGKSTLARVLAGLELCDSDCFFVNGACMTQVDIQSYRKQVAYVGQNPFLFSDTIQSNVDFLDSCKSDADVQQVLRLAALESDVSRFPEGIQTLIGEKGVVLSGGQKARLALARALYKQASVLVLDDVFSAVDHDTESILMENLLSEQRADQAVILVSHRISALLDCDVIYVLDQGNIVDSGTHAELIQRDGVYRYTWEYQKRYE